MYPMNQTEIQQKMQQLLARAKQADAKIAKLQLEKSALQQALKDAGQKTNIAEQLKQRFLANVSHEIRTPMNGILGMTELLLGTDLDESQTRFALSIARSTESLLFIINDMLDISKLQKGKIELEESVFFSARLVKDICAAYEDKAKEKNLKLSYQINNDPAQPVIGDEFRVRQILSNLLDNAIKFTETGEIIVTEHFDDRGFTGISVTDTGNGISSEVQSDIFKSFSQEDNSSTRRFGGTGLGLSISNSLARLMSGEIEIHSQVGKGSTFTFKCRLKAGDNEAIAQIGKEALGGIKALVVDDTQTNLEILQLQLEQWDIEVHCAQSGDEALIKLYEADAKSSPFKLALLDLNMPNMDGLELAQHIKNSKIASDIRVMMLTSSMVDLSDTELSERGILKSMLKPAKQAQLYETLIKLLDLDETNAAAPVHMPNKPTRILLTEDDPINQEVATIMLESMGYDVVVADNGSEAVETLINDTEFDLVLMDCQMPVMDGFNATRAIRDNNCDIPIVALTANANEGDKELCLEAGMNDYLTKPIHKTDLSRVVYQWVTTTEQNESGNPGITDKHESSENEMKIDIDQTALDAIRALQRPGKPDILARIVNMYMEKSPELISAIKEGVASNDSDKVKMAAHTLKSSSAYVGASALAEVCNRIESKASNDDLGSTAEDIALVNDGFESVVSQIKQYG